MPDKNYISSDKRISRNTISLYIRSILILVVSLYTSRVLLSELGQVDFGVYNVVAGFVMLFTFMNTAMVNSIQRFLNYSLGNNDNNGFIRTFRSSLLIQILFVVILIILLETVGLWYVKNKLNVPTDRYTAALFLYHLSVVTFTIKILQAPFSAVIISKEKMSFYAVQGILESTFLLLIAFCLNYSNSDKLKLYAVLLAVVAFVIFVMNIIYVHRIDNKIKFIPIWEKQDFKALMSFSGWSVFGSVSTIAKSQGLNLILNFFFDVLVNASRGISSQVFSGISTFVANFQTAFKPQLIQSYAEGNFNRYKQLTFLGTKISVYIMWFFTLPIILSINPLLSLWLGDGNVPVYAASFTVIALLTGVVDAYASPIAMAVSATGNIKNFQILVSIFKLLIIPIAIYLCNSGYSPEIILIVGLLLDIIAIFIRLLVWRRVYEVNLYDYLKSVFLPTTFVILITYILSNSIISKLPPINSVMLIFLIVILSLIVNAISVLYIGMSRSERANLIKVIK